MDSLCITDQDFGTKTALSNLMDQIDVALQVSGLSIHFIRWLMFFPLQVSGLSIHFIRWLMFFQCVKYVHGSSHRIRLWGVLEVRVMPWCWSLASLINISKLGSRRWYGWEVTNIIKRLWIYLVYLSYCLEILI